MHSIIPALNHPSSHPDFFFIHSFHFHKEKSNQINFFPIQSKIQNPNQLPNTFEQNSKLGLMIPIPVPVPDPDACGGG